MAKLSYQALNSLFDYINCRMGTVIWVRDETNTKQLYISESYQSVWGHDCETLYKAPDSFNKIVMPTDHRVIEPLMKKRRISEGAPEDNVAYYRIAKADGKVSFVRDSCYILSHKNGQKFGVAGICQTLTEQEWEAYFQNNSVHELDIQSADNKQFISDIILREMRYNLVPKHYYESHSTGIDVDHYNIYAITGENIHFSKREKECIYYLAQGKSAKQTGLALNISSRTIETYFESIKEKLKCRTKLEILNKVVVEIM